MNSVLTIFAKSAVHLFTVCVKFLSVKTNKINKKLFFKNFETKTKRIFKRSCSAEESHT